MAKGNLYRERSIEATRLHQGTLSETKRRIAKLYEQAAEDLASTAGRAKSSLTRQWANSYIKEMRGRVGELWQDVGELTRRGMAKEASRGVAIQTGLLGDAAELAHLDLRSRFAATFAHTPDEAIAAVIQGKLYSGKKAMLSKRIWNNAELQSGGIEQVILQGLAKQQSPVQLAKALQAYVNPKALKPDIWNDIYEGCPFPLRVDYNAKRLAVTSINHAYYSSVIMIGRDNPFAVGLQWELSSFHTIYDVCDLYMEHDEGLGIGVYSFDNAPIPHPFCMCNWYVTEGERSLADIAKELHRWTQGESNPRLDRAFGEWRGYANATTPEMRRGQTKEIYGAMPHATFSTLPDDPKEKLEAINNIIGQYCNAPSKWNGKVQIVKDFGPKGRGTLGRMNWDFSITLRENVGTDVYIHELLHTRSCGHYQPSIFAQCRKMEEGVVQLMTQAICERAHIPYALAYAPYVSSLKSIHQRVFGGMDAFSFAQLLFDIPLPNRYNYLSIRINDYLMMHPTAPEEVKKIQKAMATVYGG